MQLNKNSGIVRYWKRVAWWMDDAEKARGLAEGTNVCAFMEQIIIGTATKAAFWAFMGGVGIPLLWICSVIAVTAAACWGQVPVGWDERCRKDPARWWFPAVCWAWGDRLHVVVRGRKFYPYHVLAVAALAIVGYALVELWRVRFGPASAQFSGEHPGLTVFLCLITIIVGILILATMGWLLLQALREFFRAIHSSDSCRVFCEWLRAKKDRVCPRIEFTE